MTIDQASMLDKAADYLAEHGWSRGPTPIRADGSACAVGAMGAVLSVEMGTMEAVLGRRGAMASVYSAVEKYLPDACLALAQEVTDVVPSQRSSRWSVDAVWIWNDSHAADVDEIMTKMRHAAKRLRNA